MQRISFLDSTNTNGNKLMNLVTTDKAESKTEYIVLTFSGCQIPKSLIDKLSKSYLAT